MLKATNTPKIMRLMRNGKEISAKLISTNDQFTGTVKPVRSGQSWKSIKYDLVDEGVELIDKYQPTPIKIPAVKGKVHCVDEWSKVKTSRKRHATVITKRWTPSLRQSDF